MKRLEDLDRLSHVLPRLENQVVGKQRIKNCDGYMDWPDRGVYFFSPTGNIGSTGNPCDSPASGPTPFPQGAGRHYGIASGLTDARSGETYEGGGNHRGSVFRERIGEAMIECHGWADDYLEWGDGSTAGRELRLSELDLERRVSTYIRELPFLWVAVDDKPGRDGDRATLERNAIAFISNYDKPAIDPRDREWFGMDSPSQKIRGPGLWNVNRVEESYDPSFLDRFEDAINEMTPP